MTEEERLIRFKRLLDEAWMQAGGMLGYMGQNPKNVTTFADYVNTHRHLSEYGGDGTEPAQQIEAQRS